DGQQVRLAVGHGTKPADGLGADAADLDLPVRHVVLGVSKPGKIAARSALRPATMGSATARRDEKEMLPPKLILSPIDFSDPSHEALDTAANLASSVGAELLLVHVVPVIPRLPSPATIFNEAEFEQELYK